MLAIIVPTLLGVFLVLNHKYRFFNTPALLRPVWGKEQIIVFLLFFWGAVGVGYGVLCLSESTVGKDTEYWGDLLDHLEYREKYQSYEWNSCCTQYQCNCTTDKDGNTSCQTCCDGCYECNDYSASYYKVGISGIKYTISEREFNRLQKKLGTKWVDNGYYTKVSKSGSCGYDGKLWTVKWQGTIGTAENIASENTYRNRVVMSSSIYKPTKVSKEDVKRFGLLDYPSPHEYHQDDLIGVRGFTNADSVIQKLQFFNGRYGKQKQVKVFLWVFNGKKDIGVLQRNYIQNGNKNEYNLIVGLQGDSVKWLTVASWCRVAKIENRLKEFVYNGIDINSFVDSSLVLLKNDFIRTEFTPLNKIVDVDPPVWGIVTMIVLQLAITIAMFYVLGGSKSF